LTIRGSDSGAKTLSSALENTVRRFYSDWSVVSPARIAEYFTEDAALVTPLNAIAVAGPAAIAGNIEIFRARFENVDVEVLTIASSGQTVLCEHVWHYYLARGVEFQVLAQDAFTFDGDRISAWRSYFDPRALTSKVNLGES
jgi:limonene-1,2-epoxide hydrolase